MKLYLVGPEVIVADVRFVGLSFFQNTKITKRKLEKYSVLHLTALLIDFLDKENAKEKAGFAFDNLEAARNFIDDTGRRGIRTSHVFNKNNFTGVVFAPLVYEIDIANPTPSTLKTINDAKSEHPCYKISTNDVLNTYLTSATLEVRKNEKGKPINKTYEINKILAPQDIADFRKAYEKEYEKSYLKNPLSKMKQLLQNPDITMGDVCRYAIEHPDSRTDRIVTTLANSI